LIDFLGTGKNEDEVVGLLSDLRCHFTSVNPKVMSIELNRIGLAAN
jgi:hypothetical protein